MICRTACVFMFASQIHDAAVMPLKTLCRVPSGGWTEEVQRFRAQILNEFIGLTGKRFYGLTRQNLFGVSFISIVKNGKTLFSYMYRVVFIEV